MRLRRLRDILYAGTRPRLEPLTCWSRIRRFTEGATTTSTYQNSKSLNTTLAITQHTLSSTRCLEHPWTARKQFSTVQFLVTNDRTHPRGLADRINAQTIRWRQRPSELEDFVLVMSSGRWSADSRSRRVISTWINRWRHSMTAAVCSKLFIIRKLRRETSRTDALTGSRWPSFRTVIGLVSRSLRATSQVSMSSRYDLRHPG